MNLKLEKRLLEGEGYQVLTANNAEETLKIMERFQPLLVLMDFQLPGTDGVELTKKLRGNPRNQELIILMLTSYDRQGDEAKAKAAGCDGYLHKPIDTQALPKVIAEYLREGHHDSHGTGQSGGRK
jgi:CheY-like chemotaxis protein